MVYDYYLHPDSKKNPVAVIANTISDQVVSIRNAKEKKEGENVGIGESDKLPNQGTIKGDVENAPPVDVGKQGKHVQGHPNCKGDKSTWTAGNNGIHDTQEAWENGTCLPDGTKVWDAGKVTGTNGETGVCVHIAKRGNIHGYPVNPERYLPGK